MLSVTAGCGGVGVTMGVVTVGVAIAGVWLVKLLVEGKLVGGVGVADGYATM